MAKVMMIGTSEDSGGGISSVIRLMKKMPVWETFSCYWLGVQTQKGFLWKLWYALKSAVKAPFIISRYDIIHFHIVPGITLIIQLPELLIAKLYGKKIIIEVHIGNQLVPYSKNRLFKWWLRQSDLILLLAHKWESLFKELYSDIKTPVHVLYNACDVLEPISMEQKQKLIIFAGTIHDNKAPDLLLQAWARLKEKYPDWRISMMGTGEIQKYQDLAKELGINDCVEFTGHVIGEAKERLFADARIYCMCSYLEGFPMVVLEAWAHSIAVVTTPVGGLPDVIDDNNNCLVFPFGKADVLAQKIDSLISDKELCLKICNNGYRLVSERFSLDRINVDLEEIYNQLLRS